MFFFIKEDYVIEQICPLEPIEEPDKVSVAVHEVKSIIKKSGALERIRGFFSTPKKKSVTFNEAQEVMLIPRLFPPSLFAKTEDDSRAVMRRNLCRKFANQEKIEAFKEDGRASKNWKVQDWAYAEALKFVETS